MHHEGTKGTQETAVRIPVTDHAVVRFLERALGVDTDELRAEILPVDVLKEIRALGDGKYPIGRGLRIVVRAGEVVTVEPARFRGRIHHPPQADTKEKGGGDAGESDDAGGGALCGDRAGVRVRGIGGGGLPAKAAAACEEQEGDR
jgi:hypothetical protein